MGRRINGTAMSKKPEHGRGGPVQATMHVNKESMELNLSLATCEIRWHEVLEWFTCAALFLLLTCRNSSVNPQSAAARRSHISTRLAPTPSLQKTNTSLVIGTPPTVPHSTSHLSHVPTMMLTLTASGQSMINEHRQKPIHLTFAIPAAQPG